MLITLESGQFGWDYLIVAEDGRDRLIQTDRDYPGTAMSFGWSPASVQRCHWCGKSFVDGREPECEHEDADGGDCDRSDPCAHRSTDGTVDCRQCGVTVGEFIAAAQQWLDDHIGDTVDNPGYFVEC